MSQGINGVRKVEGGRERVSNSRETRLSTIDFRRVPETPSQGEIADPRQKDVLQVDYSTQLEFSNYRIAS